MSEIIEQRVKPTLIRRRAKKEDAAPTDASASVPASAQVSVPVSQAAAPRAAQGTQEAQETQTAVVKEAPVEKVFKPRLVQDAEKPVPKQVEALIKPASTKVAELEDKFKKAPKKKLSKAEMEFEAIKRAGGLKHFVGSEEVAEVVEPVQRDRVFEPGPRRKKHVKREFKRTNITQPKASKKVIKIAEAITVSELSQDLGVKASELIQKLVALGVMVTVNQSIDVDAASIIAKEYDYEVEHVAFKEKAVIEEAKQKRTSNIVNRSPVVTVMGHVDHGKTSILDYIRKTKVAAGEAGGITQHMGSYEVSTPKGRITFIDTPGHAAFTAMRARGAKVTDIVVLVVAADDGVMPQTKEAADHARAAGVKMIVAINKIDKPEANIERVKRSLSEYNIIPEEWGGDVICVNTSAKSGEGIDHLLEMILLQSEVMELKADVSATAKGTIIEARLDRGLGPVATVLVQEGMLNVGAPIICGLYCGKIRTLINSRGEQVQMAGPSEAVSIIGLSGVPLSGDELQEMEDEKTARFISETRQKKQRTEALIKTSRASLEDLQKQVADGTAKELNVVVKADVHGSVEAIKEALPRLSTEKVKVSVIHTGVGGITESDVMLASASTAIIVGFNVVPEVGVFQIAEREGVEIRRYSIIYELLDEVRKSMEGLLTPLSVEKVVGHAQVRQVFNISKLGTIAGCSVSDGKIVRTAGARLVRDSVIVWSGKIASLKKFKDDAREVTEGNECGIGLEKYNDIKEGDVIEAFIIEQIAQKL